MAVSLTVVMGMAAFGIDAASWMLKHHQAQVVADSAALAAAQCLADPGQSGTINVHGTITSVPACTSSTDTTDAQTVAIDYAAANGLTITASNVSVDTTNDKVTVTAPETSSTIFARIFGEKTTTQSAGAGASWSSTSTVCSNPGSSCDFLFAHNSNCTSSANGIDLTMSGNTTVEGNIQSNANISGATSGNISLGTATYGPNTDGTCSNSLIYSGHDPWTTPPTQSATDAPFPIDYTQDFPACGGSGDPCQSNGYPSFCTNEGTSITLTGSTNGDTTITGNVYCASGTGTKSTPSTWNGTITITLSGSATLYDTYVGGSVSFTGSGSDVLSSCGYTTSGYSSSLCNTSVPAPTTTNYPIFYATGTSSTAIKVTVSGSQVFNGDLFAPNGTAALTMSGNKTLTTFVEANNISGSISGTFMGDGPSSGGAGTAGPGVVSLVQ